MDVKADVIRELSWKMRSTRAKWNFGVPSDVRDRTLQALKDGLQRPGLQDEWHKRTSQDVVNIFVPFMSCVPQHHVQEAVTLARFCYFQPLGKLRVGICQCRLESQLQ